MLLLCCWEWSLMVPTPIPLLVSLDIDLRKNSYFSTYSIPSWSDVTTNECVELQWKIAQSCQHSEHHFDRSGSVQTMSSFFCKVKCLNMTRLKLSHKLKFHFWPSTKRYLQPRSETGSWKKCIQLYIFSVTHWPKSYKNQSLPECECLWACVWARPLSLCVVSCSVWRAVLSAVSLFTKISSKVKFFKWPQ